MTRQDWMWAVAMVLCAFVMALAGWTGGYHTGKRDAEERCPVRPEDFSVGMACERGGHMVPCDKRLAP